MMSGVEEDVLVMLALRYFDGTAGPSDMAALERLLLRSEDHRRWFLQMAQQATVMSDFHRVECSAATALAEGAVESNEWGRDSKVCAMVVCEGDDHEDISLVRSSSHSEWRRSLSAIAAAGAAAMVALAGLVLWWAAEPPPIAEAAPLASAGDVNALRGEAFGLPVSQGASAVHIAPESDLPLSSPWGNADPGSQPMSAQSHASVLFHSNALTFWNLCRLAAQSDARQAISSTLLGMARLEFSFEPYSFSSNENLYDWIYPRLLGPGRMNVEP